MDEEKQIKEILNLIAISKRVAIAINAISVVETIVKSEVYFRSLSNKNKLTCHQEIKIKKKDSREA